MPYVSSCCGSRLIEIPYPCSDEQYAAVMADFAARASGDGVRCMAFGDLYLRDVRRYREERMQGTGIEAVFPLWGRPTRPLLGEMLAGGLRACLTCVDPRVLPAEFAGRELTPELLDSIPSGIDPCGENGEFHTFAFDGPMFTQPLDIERRAKLLRAMVLYLPIAGCAERSRPVRRETIRVTLRFLHELMGSSGCSRSFKMNLVYGIQARRSAVVSP